MIQQSERSYPQRHHNRCQGTGRAWWTCPPSGRHRCRSTRHGSVPRFGTPAARRMLTWRKTVNPYTFLVGAARSGTTLLKRIVDTHPQIAITPESHWISRYVKEGLVPEGRVTPDI